MKDLFLLGLWSYISGACLFLFCTCVAVMATEGFDIFLLTCAGITWGSFVVTCTADVLLMTELRASARKGGEACSR